MYYKKNRARYRGKDTKTRTPFLMQVPMKRLLAHVRTKDELTQYLASKTLEKGRQNGLHVVVATLPGADTSFVTRRGQRHPNIQLCPIVRTLGAARMAELPGFHAWSGGNVAGNFAFKGKLECWKAFLEAGEECHCTSRSLFYHFPHVLCNREASVSTIPAQD